MAEFVGIDLGSHMIKGVVLRDAGARAEVLNLAPLDGSPTLPCVVQDGAARGAQWSQYFRRRSDAGVTFGFRDRIWEFGSRLALAGASTGAVEILQSLCRGAREAVVTAAPQVSAIGVSVPDRWPRDTQWALPRALAADGWNPALLARESTAVLADWLTSQTTGALRNVLLVSFGAGSTCASLMSRSDEGAWQRAGTAAEDAVSGAALRAGLMADIVREVIARTRKDPSESALDDQGLHNGVEQLLQALLVAEEASFQATIFGEVLTIPYSRTRLAGLCRPMVNRIAITMAEWRKRFSSREPIDAVLYWGDLAARLNLAGDLQPIFRSAEIHALSPYCVAGGVARMVALVQQGQLVTDAAGRCESLTLFEHLPACDALGDSRQQVLPRLVRLDGPQPESYSVRDALRLGRDSLADVVIAPAYGQVSNAHAVLLRKGTLYVLSDLQSTNGTYVNGKLLSGPAPLAPGDTIQLGVDGPRFRFESS